MQTFCPYVKLSLSLLAQEHECDHLVHIPDLWVPVLWASWKNVNIGQLFQPSHESNASLTSQLPKADEVCKWQSPTFTAISTFAGQTWPTSEMGHPLFSLPQVSSEIVCCKRMEKKKRIATIVNGGGNYLTSNYISNAAERKTVTLSELL